MHLLEASISREASSRLLFPAPSRSWSLLTLISSYLDIVPVGELPTNSPANCRMHMYRRVWEPGCILASFNQDAAWYILRMNTSIRTTVGADESCTPPIHRPFTSPQ